MDMFDLQQPHTVQEAIAALAEDPEDSKVLAGGQSFMVMLRTGLLRPSRVISLNRLGTLRSVSLTTESMVLGSMISVRTIETSSEIQALLPMLSEAAADVASVHIRHLGTIGGNVCHSLVGADLPPPLLAMGARFSLEGPSGTRVVPAENFFRGMMETVLAADEILTLVTVPLPPFGWSSAYVKFAVRAVDPALVGVAVMMKMSQVGRVEDVRIGLGGAGDTPVRASHVEQALVGQRLSDSLLAEVSQEARNDIECISDAHASAWYRERVLPLVVAEAIRRAAARNAGQTSM